MTVGVSRAGAGSVTCRAADFIRTQMQVDGAQPLPKPAPAKAGGVGARTALTLPPRGNGDATGALPTCQVSRVAAWCGYPHPLATFCFCRDHSSGPVVGRNFLNIGCRKSRSMIPSASSYWQAPEKYAGGYGCAVLDNW